MRSSWWRLTGCGIIFLLAGSFGAWGQSRVGNNAYGDSGIFHLFSPRTLEQGKFALAGSFDNVDRDPLDIDQSDYRVGLAFGLSDWLEIQASLDAYRAIELDPKAGRTGVLNTVAVLGNQDYRTGLGDIWVGLKAQLLDITENPVGLGLVGRVKIPSASDSDGLGTGKVDVDVRGLVEINAQDVAGIYGNAGFLLRGNPDVQDAGNQFVYGVGAVLPYESRIQFMAELSGGVVESSGQIDDYLDVAAGLRFFITDEVNLSIAYRRNLQADHNMREHPDGAVVTLGYWPQKEVLLEPDLSALPAPPEPTKPQVSLPPPPPKPVFHPEEVYFAFDKYDLRDTEIAKLDALVAYLSKNPDQRVVIEGHTCYIGTEEYNMALGQQRAETIRAYLVNHGISNDRIKTISYGENRPKYDNSREVTRRFNRRAWFVLRTEPNE